MRPPQGKVMGCHNWMQVYNEERKGHLNYQGYIRPKQARVSLSDALHRLVLD
jgi:hypothetical protein